MKLLLSAYACDPGKGSEPGVGWNWVRHAARFHEVWVITRANNRPAIQVALEWDPLPNARFLYYDLPAWACFWKSGSRGVRLYYCLWQLGAARLAAALHREVHFDLAQHLTFGVHWLPTMLARLPVPFVWGPVGGAERMPHAFRYALGPASAAFELARDAVRFCGEHLPAVRTAARRTAIGLAKARDTETRLRAMGCRRTALVSEAALDEEDLRELAALPLRADPPVRVLSVGRLLRWKGFELGLRAFASLAARVPEAEYWIVGDGPVRGELEHQIHRLGLDGRVVLRGRLPRRDVLESLAHCDLLLHPSLHDSGGWVCLEAMAAGRPVVCLDLGGPALQVHADTGIVVSALTPAQVVEDMSAALIRLAGDAALRRSMGEAGRRHVQAHYAWPGREDLWSRWAAEIGLVEYACPDPA